MPKVNPVRCAALRGLIANFINERLQAKLDKLKDDDPERPAQVAQLLTQHSPAVWLADAARRSAQLQVVTHALKGTHPDARGSSLCIDPAALPDTPELSSRVLDDAAERDVVGNAAALDVYKFLKLCLPGETRHLLALSRTLDADWLAALSDDPAQATAWAEAFARMEKPRGVPATHTLAKQVYWQVGLDAHAESHFHLLAPLYPTALVHKVHEVLQAHRFGDEAKAARQARKDEQWYGSPTHDYPQLAFQQLGGTKPQNISQLNSERRGANPLLASLPPLWDLNRPTPPLRVDSLFEQLKHQPGVRAELKALKQFLEQDPARNLSTRQQVMAGVERLLDALIQFSASVRELEPGWSMDPACRLPSAQRIWLDPEGFDNPKQLGADDALDAVAGGFGIWLNEALRGALSMDADTAWAWRQAAHVALRDLLPALPEPGTVLEASHAN